MAKYRNYNGRFCESDFENAFISFLEQEKWTFLSGDKIARSNQKEVLIDSDLITFLSASNKELDADEVRQIADNVRLVGAETDFAPPFIKCTDGWLMV